MSDNQRLTKHDLRRRMLDMRNNINTETVQKTEDCSFARIVQYIENLSKKKERPLHIMSYMSYKNEFPTHRLNNYILTSEHTLILPYTDSELVITAYRTDSLNELRPSKMGISEPVPELCEVIPVEIMDLIIMPGIAFDTSGNRIGFGKGCYDRFLAKCTAPLPQLTALAYSFQITENIPHEPTDIPCKTIITENEIFECLL